MKHYNIFLFSFFLLLMPLVSFAGSAHNVSGWIWSENVGWISLNSKNCDGNNDGLSDGTPSGCPLADVAIGNYGVNIDPGTGLFTGYAWSEYAGWLSFEAADVTGCPTVPPLVGCQGDLDFGTNKVTGWARFLAGSGDGWDGWVHLRGFASDVGATEYGVARNLSQLTGWAWGGDVVGWIKFNGTTFQTQLASEVSQGGTITVEATNLDGSRYFGPLSVEINGPTMLTTSDAPALAVPVLPGSYTFAYVSGGPGGGVLGSISPSSLEVGQGSNLTVALLFTNPPLRPSDPGGSGGAPTTSKTVSDATFFCPSTQVVFAWLYSDPNSDPQGAYDLEVYNDVALTSLRFSTGTRLSSETFHINALPLEELFYNATYYWRVRVRDIDGAWSYWSLTNSFTTPATCIVVEFSLVSSKDIFVNLASQQITKKNSPLIPVASAQVLARSSATTITVVPLPFTDPVSLSVVPPILGFCSGSEIPGLPLGANPVFMPSVLTSAEYDNGIGAQFYVEVPNTTPEGVYCLDVQGEGGSPPIVRDTKVLLSVILKDPRFKEF